MSAELLIQTDIIKFFKEFLNSPVFRTASVVILLILIILVIIIIKSIISRILSAYKEIKTENFCNEYYSHCGTAYINADYHNTCYNNSFIFYFLMAVLTDGYILTFLLLPVLHNPANLLKRKFIL